MFKLVLEKAEEPDNRVPGSAVFTFTVQENFILVDDKDRNLVNFL